MNGDRAVNVFNRMAKMMTHLIPLTSPQDYLIQMEAAFNGKDSKLNCKVEDVFVVPDFQYFFESAIDKHFGRMHKREWTQHQYRFEAVKATTFHMAQSSLIVSMHVIRLLL